MSSWLDPLRASLDAASTPVHVFFRDDDAGWNDARLTALLDVFAQATLPLDLAVIPQALTAKFATVLRQRKHTQPLGLHQHGFSHANHQIGGRKCEFGSARGALAQYQDIAQGKRRLQEKLGSLCDPIFTPPWNRCSAPTVAALCRLEFAVLSRDSGAEALPLHGLRELPVGLDWCRFAGQRAELSLRLAALPARARPMGIMLHHAVMTDEDLSAVGELLALLRRHSRITCRRMLALNENNTPTRTASCAF